MGDGEAVRAVRDGRSEAYTDLVERYQERIYRLCYHVAGNAADADELAHDAFVEAYVKLGQLREPDRFGPWLRALALNLCRMWYRDQRQRVDASLCVPAPPPDDEPATDHAAVYAGLSRLSPAHRLALVLHYWEGLSYEEVSRFLDVPLGTVMSRLYRARKEMKRHLEQAGEENVAMASDESFRREVEAEIRLLAQTMGQGDADAAERLTVLLRRSPERMEALLADPGEERALRDLATLLGRLGPGAMDAALDHAFGGPRRDSAVRLLELFVEQSRPGPRLPARGLYVLLDRILEHRAAADAKARLLVDLLLHAGKNEQAALLLANGLMTYPDAALPVLLERFWRSGKPTDVYREGDVLWALCRLGTRFGEALVPALEADRGPRAVALAGAEALARTLHHEPYRLGRPGWFDLDRVSDEEVALDARMRRKWAIPLRCDRDQQVLERLGAAVARSAACPDPWARATAVRTLGLLRRRPSAGALESAAHDPEASVRVAALRALGDLGEPGTAGTLAEALRSPSAEERRTAVESLSSLALPDSLPAIAALLDDPDARTRQAAVSALRHYAPDQVLPLLEGVTEDGPTKSAALRAMYAARKAQEQTRAAGPHGTLMGDMLRDGAMPVNYLSLEVALRALPEDRTYDETGITKAIAQVTIDYSSVRRYLVEEGLVRREAGVYELTEAGRTAWRVERAIRDRYVRGRTEGPAAGAA